MRGSVSTVICATGKNLEAAEACWGFRLGSALPLVCEVGVWFGRGRPVTPGSTFRVWDPRFSASFAFSALSSTGLGRGQRPAPARGTQWSSVVLGDSGLSPAPRRVFRFCCR